MNTPIETVEHEPSNQVAIIEPVRLMKEPPQELAHLADMIRQLYPECQQAFADFNEKRFKIGMAMLLARGLIANVGGDRRSENWQGGSIGHGVQFDF